MKTLASRDESAMSVRLELLGDVKGIVVLDGEDIRNIEITEWRLT